jgi:hypothetical protein
MCRLADIDKEGSDGRTEDMATGLMVDANPLLSQMEDA